MAKIVCEVFEIQHPEDGKPAVEATCTECGHTTVSFGTSDKSIKRCLVLMREECPRGERNFYVDDDEDDNA